MSGVEASTHDETAPGRQCARCRLIFPIEEGTHPMELIGWWTCPTCTQSLLPARHRTNVADEAQRER